MSEKRQSSSSEGYYVTKEMFEDDLRLKTIEEKMSIMNLFEKRGYIGSVTQKYLLYKKWSYTFIRL